MAAFLKRLAEKKIVDAATAVNATNAAQADNATNAAQAGNVTNADQADNASALEGLTAAELAPRAAFNSTDDAPDGADYSLQTQITAPTRGILLMTRGIEASKVTAFNNYMCFVNNIGPDGPMGSIMRSTNAGGSNTNENEDCTTSGAMVVDAGTYTIELGVRDVVATTMFGGASVWGDVGSVRRHRSNTNALKPSGKVEGTGSRLSAIPVIACRP